MGGGERPARVEGAFAEGAAVERGKAARGAYAELSGGARGVLAAYARIEDVSS